MAIVVNFAQARTSRGYKSGRNSWRGTPVTFSTAKTRKGGTSSHCDIACGEIPSKDARFTGPSTAEIARSNASRLFMVDNVSIACTQLQAFLHCQGKALLYDIDMPSIKRRAEAKPLTLGARIRLAREKRRLTQQQVGDIFGISHAAVSGWERNQDFPDIHKLVPLARKLGVPLEWLLDGDGLPPDNDELSDLINGLSGPQRRQAARLLRALAPD